MSETRGPGVGIFGYGLMAAAHAAALRRAEATLVGVCGPRPDAAAEFAARFGIPLATSDPDALLGAADVDAVLVDASDDAHCDLTLRALAAGKHVLCEKPLAASTAECMAMVRAASSASTVSMVGYSNRRFPWILAGKELVDSGALGRIYHVHMQSLSASMLRQGASLRWRADPARAPAGVLADLGSHYIDLLRLFFGEVLEVCGEILSLSNPSIAPDDCTLLFRLSDDIHGTLVTSKLSPVDRQYAPGRRHILISGSCGALRLENGGGRFFPLDGEPRDIAVPPQTAEHETYLAGSTAPTVHAFLEAIARRTAPSPSFVDGLRCQEVIDAALESQRTHSWQPVVRHAVTD